MSNFYFCNRDEETGAPLEGAIFKLYSDGWSMASATSKRDGTVYFYDIYPGTYSLVEVSAPSGYEKSSNRYKVKVTSYGKVYIEDRLAKDFTVTNSKIINSSAMNNKVTSSKGRGTLGEFTIIKFDRSTGNVLGGAIFELLDGDKVIGQTTSDEEGNVTFSNLPPGRYTLVEARAPEGFKQTKLTHTVVVSRGGCVTVNGYTPKEITIANEPR